MKAMILAAGFGTRLLPATKYLPKPCFPLKNVPIIIRIINNLTAAGVTDIIINLHHKPEIIKSTVESNMPDGVNIEYSCEKEILGTGGGIKKVEEMLKGGTFILHNGDIYSGVDLNEAVNFHKEKGAKATMVVKRGEHKSFIGLDGERKIARFPYGPTKGAEYEIKTYFTGIHVLEPQVFDYIPDDEFYGINARVYPDMIADGHAAYGYITDAYWQDIGTAVDFLDANWYLSGNDGPIVGEGTVMGDECTINSKTVIGRGCTIKSGCTIEDSVIFDDVDISDSVTIKGSIILSGCSITANKRIDGQIVTKKEAAEISV